MAEKDRKKVAIEIETGKSDSIYNIRKDLIAGFDEVLVVALSPEAEKRIRNAIPIMEVGKKERVKIINQNQFFLV